MREDGVTLIELLVVTSIIGILVIALGFSFDGWMSNYKIESQTKDIYADLMDARSTAMTRSRMHFMVLNAGNYAGYEDTNENFTADPGAGDNPLPAYRDPGTFNLRPKQLASNYQLICSNPLPATVTIDTRGLMSWNPVTPTLSFHIDNTKNPDYDCIIIEQARIQTGKWDAATTTCEAK